jgi:hypothetical protein
MKIHSVTRQEFLELAYENTAEFLKKIDAPEAFIVKQFYAGKDILELRRTCFERGIATPASWHPLYDDCPDYHRLHDNYPQAYVKSRMHAFYHHGFYKSNAEIFRDFNDIFALKNYLAGCELDAHVHNKPSDGFIARVNLHHYPKGGGGQAEHIDPWGKLARVQTLIAASQIGKDYRKGGVYARTHEGGEQFFLDEYTEPGDMMVLSPAIPHGVAPIDPEENYSWETNDGRWIVLPLFVASDYPNPSTDKPRELQRA